MHEMTHSPRSVLQPLTKICRNTLNLCVGQHRFSSKFVDLLLFAIRMCVRVLKFRRFARERTGHNDGESVQTLSTALTRLLKDATALLLTRWIHESEAASDVRRSVQLHVHLAMIRSVACEADDVELFLKSAAYVVGWHSKGQSKGDKRKSGNVAKNRTSVAPCATPIHAAFEALQSLRPIVLEWCDRLSLDETKLDLLTDIFNVAMRRTDLSDVSAVVAAEKRQDIAAVSGVGKEDDALAGWHRFQKSTMCSHTIESEHRTNRTQTFTRRFTFQVQSTYRFTSTNVHTRN